MASQWDDGVWRHYSGGHEWWLRSDDQGACPLTIQKLRDGYWISHDNRPSDQFELGPLEDLDLAKKAYRVLLATHRY